MLKPEMEEHSGFEGLPLPFFQLLPGKKGFFFVRIVLEPAFVFVLTTILGNFAFITPGLKAYLHFCALCLVMKEFIDWHQCWTPLPEGRFRCGRYPSQDREDRQQRATSCA